METSKIQQRNDQYVMEIPSRVAETLEIKDGDSIVFELVTGSVVMKKLDVMSRTVKDNIRRIEGVAGFILPLSKYEGWYVSNVTYDGTYHVMLQCDHDTHVFTVLEQDLEGKFEDVARVILDLIHYEKMLTRGGNLDLIYFGMNGKFCSIYGKGISRIYKQLEDIRKKDAL